MPQVQIIEPTIRPQKQKIRVCAYARVSSNSDDQLNSFSAQVEYFTQLIQAHSDWESAFVTLYNKLGRNRSEILTPFITQVEKLRDKNFMSHPGAMQLNKEIADLLEQNHALATLRAKECIDSAFYMSETNTNNTKLENLRKELQRYRDLNDYHEILNGSYLLLKIFEEQESISEFEPVAFRNMVIKVRIFSDTICFRLINGMELAERR